MTAPQQQQTVDRVDVPQQQQPRQENSSSSQTASVDASSSASAESGVQSQHIELSHNLICSRAASADDGSSASAAASSDLQGAAAAGGDGSEGDVCSSLSFDEDIAAFARELNTANGGPLTADEELDSLMIQAIQVLRLHLLELEKVHELCDNFCTRYITCLKGKMTVSEVDLNSAPPPQEQQQQQQMKFEAEQQAAPPLEAAHLHIQQHQPPLSNSEQPPIVLPMYHHQPPVPLLAVVPPPPPPPPPLLQGATPAARPMPAETGPMLAESFEASLGSGSGAASQDDETGLDVDCEKRGGDSGGEEAEARRRRQRKRGIFPKCATNIMRAWLFQNLSHPYPSEEQKKQLSGDTGLTILQVNNWFINARRRIVQPMVDQSGQSGTSDSSADAAANMPPLMEHGQTPRQLRYPASLPALHAAAASCFPGYPHPGQAMPAAAAGFQPQPHLPELHRQPQHILLSTDSVGQYETSATAKFAN
uniref:Homeobox domain-containing protein n=1 Tax=Macrostomum lignano TaxID=282301 RepID=A0A1I8JGG0_9PLAT